MLHNKLNFAVELSAQIAICGRGSKIYSIDIDNHILSTRKINSINLVLLIVDSQCNAYPHTANRERHYKWYPALLSLLFYTIVQTLVPSCSKYRNCKPSQLSVHVAWIERAAEKAILPRSWASSLLIRCVGWKKEKFYFKALFSFDCRGAAYSHLAWMSYAVYCARNEWRKIFCTFCASSKYFLSVDSENFAGAKFFCKEARKFII
jgi:hypothetical protein